MLSPADARCGTALPCAPHAFARNTPDAIKDYAYGCGTSDFDDDPAAHTTQGTTMMCVGSFEEKKMTSTFNLLLTVSYGHLG